MVTIKEVLSPDLYGESCSEPIRGIDCDIPMARYTHPLLSTVRVDIVGLGARAATRLLEAVGNTAGIASGGSGSPSRW